MIFWWLGLSGFGAFGSSESVRGSLNWLAMATPPLPILTQSKPRINLKLLNMLEYFTKIAHFGNLYKLGELSKLLNDLNRLNLGIFR